MSSRKRRRSTKKRSLRFKLVVCACLLLAPTVLGGTCGAAHYLLPRAGRFGDTQPADKLPLDTMLAAKRGCLTGAATGVVVGIAACVAYTWASRQKKR